jgi:hypothetical protein
MKSKVWVPFFVLILLILLTMSVSAELSSVTANVTVSSDIVTVTGITSVGANKSVTILVKSQTETIVYIDQKESGEGGQYSFSFKMPSTAMNGTYTVKVGGEEINAPTINTFIYTQAVIPPTELVTATVTVSSDIVTVTGITSIGANKGVTILVKSQTETIVYIDQKESGEGGQYSFSFKMPSTAMNGTYTVKVGGEEINTPTIRTFTYTKTNGTVDTTVPTAPTNLTASNITGTTVDLSWTASTDDIGVVGYDVYKDSAKVLTVIVPSCTLQGLSSNSTYSITVKAKDAANNQSIASNEISVVIPSTDTSVNLSIASGQQIILNATATNMLTFLGKVFTITYDANSIEIIDAVADTMINNTSVGQVVGSNIYITENTPGTLKFSINKAVPQNQLWSGVINKIKFRGKITANTEIVLTY